MSRIVAISGAAGFVGRRLVTRLIELGYEVIALDLVDPQITGSIFHFFDIGDDLMQKKVNLPKNSIFVHLAAMSTDSQCKQDIIGAVNINLVGTARVIDLVNLSSCSKLIFASSEWVYPEKQDQKLQTEHESLELENLNSLYAMTKLMGENLVRVACKIPSIILRFGIVYGPRSKAGSAPESISYKIAQGEDVSVGAGKTSRRFIYVDDLVEGIVSAIEGDVPQFNSIYNLSGSELISLIHVAETAQRITGNNVQVIDGGALPSIRNPDPSKFIKDFGFTPHISLADGLKACIDAMG